MLITGETGYAVYGNSILSSEFFCELKTILKNKKLIKRKFFVSKGDPLLPEDTEKVSLNWKLPLLPGNFGPLVPGDGPMRNCHLGKVIALVRKRRLRTEMPRRRFFSFPSF